MPTADLLSRVQDILVDVLMLDDPSRVTPAARIVEDLGAESINVAEIAVALENEFHLVIEDEGMRGLTTVQALVDYVEGLIKAAQPA